MKSPNWKEVTAIFGGTFDPPHLGHRMAVEGLFENPGVKEVIVVPSGYPPLKEDTVGTTRERLAMAKLCFDLPGVSIDRSEIDRAEEMMEPTYTIETLLQLSHLPHKAFVIGTDQLKTLSKWLKFKKLLILCHWIVLERKGEASIDPETLGWDVALTKLVEKTWEVEGKTVIHLCETPAPDISSREIRHLLSKGKMPEGVLPRGVADYLAARPAIYRP